MIHCWTGYREYLEETGRENTPEHIATYTEGSKTCMLEDGHSGEHEWTDDCDIGITFPAAESDDFEIELDESGYH